jgi:hypothetical protein
VVAKSAAPAVAVVRAASAAMELVERGSVGPVDLAAEGLVALAVRVDPAQAEPAVRAASVAVGERRERLAELEQQEAAETAAREGRAPTQDLPPGTAALHLLRWTPAATSAPMEAPAKVEAEAAPVEAEAGMQGPVAASATAAFLLRATPRPT